jgi:hypothetical protein
MAPGGCQPIQIAVVLNVLQGDTDTDDLLVEQCPIRYRTPIPRKYTHCHTNLRHKHQFSRSPAPQNPLTRPGSLEVVLQLVLKVLKITLNTGSPRKLYHFDYLLGESLGSEAAARPS